MENEGTSRRNWAVWLRRLGMLTPGAVGPDVRPEVSQVLLVGDESALQPTFEPPWGFAGGFIAAGASRRTIAIAAPPAGCWVRARYVLETVQGRMHLAVVPRVILATLMPVRWSDAVGSTVVSQEDLGDAALVTLGVPYSGAAQPDTPAFWQTAAQIGFLEVSWLWVGPSSSLLLIADVADDVSFAAFIREGGAPERG